MSLRDKLLALDLGPGASDHERAFLRLLADRIGEIRSPHGIKVVVALLIGGGL